MEKTIYFDHGATTKVDNRVLKKMIPYFSTNYANPSSMYFLGRSNKRVAKNCTAKSGYKRNRD